MNPLGTLPGSTAPRYSINTLDLQKILRFLLVQIIGLALTMGVPYLTGLHYVWGGIDYTPQVVILVNTAAEAVRRFLSGDSPAPPAVE